MSIQATATQSTFRMECAITCNINATKEKVWQLLTDVSAQSRWNSTLTSIQGSITPGGQVMLEAKSSPGRKFRLKVTSFTPNTSMVWEDGFAPMFKGVRTFSVAAQPDGTTYFEMIEVFSGLMLPLIKGSLPDFVPVFEQYAADLKREAEKS